MEKENDSVGKYRHRKRKTKSQSSRAVSIKEQQLKLEKPHRETATAFRVFVSWLMYMDQGLVIWTLEI